MTKIFLWEIPAKPGALFQHTKNLRLDDLKKLDSISDSQRRLEFTASRFLLKHIPFRPYTSLSHCLPLIAIASSNSPVGIDIENTQAPRNFTKLLQSRYFSEQEKSLYTTPLLFYKAWTLKEAYAKFTQRGLSAELSQLTFDFSQNKVTQWPHRRDSLRPTFRQYFLSPFVISLCHHEEKNSSPALYQASLQDKKLSFSFLKREGVTIT
ncbi:MAG: 4'-phosphopantetheinyl transferase superfamily protein [Bdellovibrio sp.]|nr:MAG: 4'-phosphopantetheinyl transferase superfamily protein [Bdellovibrio sp.]